MGGRWRKIRRAVGSMVRSRVCSKIVSLFCNASFSLTLCSFGAVAGSQVAAHAEFPMIYGGAIGVSVSVASLVTVHSYGMEPYKIQKAAAALCNRLIWLLQRFSHATSSSQEVQ